MQLAVLIVYSLGLLALGLWIGRRVESSGGFFVAGRALGPVLLFATVLAANIGAGSTVGAAGLGYDHGLSGWWWVGSAGIGTFFLAFWIGPRIWRLAREHELMTVGDYLEFRYDRTVRGIIAVLLWIGTLAILAGQLIALAWILDVVAGVPKPIGCLIGGGVMTIYFTAGGLLTSAWVNLVQLVVLLVGFAIALPWVLADVGGWAGLVAAAPTATSATGTDYLGFWGGTRSWTYLALLVPAFIVSPGLLQKVYGARDERTIRWGVGLCALALTLFAAVPPLLGMMARAYDPALANGELALPTVLTHGLPIALGSIGLAAVLSAEMSSADAILFMLSTSLSKDLYQRFVKPDASDAEVLRVARLAAVVGGGLGVALAIVLPSVISSLAVFYSLLSVSLFVPVVFGLQWRRLGTPEALAAIGGGVTALVAVRLAPWGESPGWLGALSPTTWGLVVSVAVCALVMAFRRARVS